MSGMQISLCGFGTALLGLIAAYAKRKCYPTGVDNGDCAVEWRRDGSGLIVFMYFDKFVNHSEDRVASERP